MVINTMPDEVVKAVRHLIRHYIERQQLVVQAMLEFRPDLIKGLKIDEILGINVDTQYEYFLEHYLGNDEIFQGMWRNEWKYLLHGYGCRLIHAQTGEPLEWDAGHPEAFYLGWFANHLDWRTAHESDDVNIQMYLRWVKEDQHSLQGMVEHLMAKHLLFRREGESSWFLAQ